MSGSISFDRAAEYYDGTRSMNAQAQGEVTDLLTAELSGAGRVLEIGVGTGRIALPLHQAGIDMTGVDLSLPMMDVLRAKGGGRAPFPLALGDATRLPFADDSFGGAVVCHVLHLIPPWAEVVDELIRVTRPGGRITHDWGYEAWDPLQERLAAEAGLPLRFPGVNSPEEADVAFEARGATTRVLPVVRDTKPFTYSQLLEGFAAGRWSWTWGAGEETRRAAVERARPWATAKFGDLDEDMGFDMATAWRAYDLP